MNVSPGTRLGPYEVIAPIGAGGMGEVWRARDTRLERSVAIKVLPAELSQNAQLRIALRARSESLLDAYQVCSAIHRILTNRLIPRVFLGLSCATDSRQRT